MDEPIIAQLLSQTTDYQDYDSIALYDLISNQQSADSLYDFNLQIPEDADVTLYQTIDGQLQKDTLDVAYAAEEYNRLPLISYQSETNHWLVLHLGSNQDKQGCVRIGHRRCSQRNRKCRRVTRRENRVGDR